MSNSTMAQCVERREHGRIRTLIVGAGIAGLTLAALLRQRGERPVIIERAERLDHLGYMLALYPQGSRILYGLGLHEKFRTGTIPMHRYNIYDGEGKLVHAYSLEELTRRYGTLHTVTRAGLLSLLQEAVGELPIDTGMTVASMKQDAEHVDVTFSDGSSSTFDLVVGSDGLHSHLRTLILAKNEYEYWDSKWGGWVFWSDPALAPANTVTEYWGAGRFVWMYPVDGHLGVFAGGPADQLKEGGVAAFAERVRAQLGPSDGSVLEILNPSTLPGDAFFWEFHDCRCARWHRGRVVLLGDAATGFLPTAGVGASMAMESAAALADELSRTDARFVEQALVLYEKRHRARVEKAQDNSRELAKIIFMGSRPLAWARNRVMKHVPVEALIKDITGMIDQPI